MNTSSIVFNQDCIIGMSKYGDNYFDLAIVDPPYGINAGKGIGKSLTNNKRIIHKDWDRSIPPKIYFDELFRVSKHQIIWGGNYFLDYLSATRCIIFWHKPNTAGRCFADGEVAWTSFNKVTRFYSRHSVDINRFHPTQKPIALYKWLLQNYAKEGDKILDTHLGSGSSRIACYDMGFDFMGYEIDKEYYEAQEQRFNEYTKQLRLI